MTKMLAIFLAIIVTIGLFGTAFAQSPGKISISVDETPIIEDRRIMIWANLTSSNPEPKFGEEDSYIDYQQVDFTLKYPQDPTWELNVTESTSEDGKALMAIGLDNPLPGS